MDCTMDHLSELRVLLMMVVINLLNRVAGQRQDMFESEQSRLLDELVSQPILAPYWEPRSSATNHARISMEEVDVGSTKDFPVLASEKVDEPGKTLIVFVVIPDKAGKFGKVSEEYGVYLVPVQSVSFSA